LPLNAVRLEAPVPRPGKVLAIGMNYADHIRETGRTAPEHQVWFAKQATCIAGPHDPIEIPKASSQVDFEAELCVVIGRRCRHVPRDRAMEVIAGFMCGNDVSVRDWQARTPTMMMGKGFDTHGPTGPWIVTPEEIADPQALGVRCLVNGQVMQDASTAEMIFGIAAQIEHLTTAFTLEPGDVIFTGTPAGVGFVVPTGLVEQLGGGLVYDAAGKGVAPTLDEEGVGPHLTQRVALLLEQLCEA
jgi:2-keto-4-pentenoate hydratase/2-oxohepta-3-ene-1,7-dioic acid hydratase in catechol pathway